MKRVNEYKKLFSVEKEIDLKTLKTTYRNLVKEWHPDKFLEGNPMKEEAEEKSRQIIDGYHFLVSIAPETKAANQEAYNRTISESGIADFQHKGLLLEISFLDGTTYEYFGVPKNIYVKLINSDRQFRFAKRSIFNSYLYRKSKKDLEMA
ncbi:KTSC domain-containing protein [uncultured Aquimarina sp.]|uniref:KTSC domain-containing protein n=1 Tax=uncultured Aquimarina sp. TaxID=575652 RepID=UPI0026161CFE|nr:KTSC domain-containing protein [uncultured Aquimarina sp.]